MIVPDTRCLQANPAAAAYSALAGAACEQHSSMGGMGTCCPSHHTTYKACMPPAPPPAAAPSTFLTTSIAYDTEAEATPCDTFDEANFGWSTLASAEEYGAPPGGLIQPCHCCE